jgi:hypothetical protein
MPPSYEVVHVGHARVPAHVAFVAAALIVTAAAAALTLPGDRERPLASGPRPHPTASVGGSSALQVDAAALVAEVSHNGGSVHRIGFRLGRVDGSWRAVALVEDDQPRGSG